MVEQCTSSGDLFRWAEFCRTYVNDNVPSHCHFHKLYEVLLMLANREHCHTERPFWPFATAWRSAVASVMLLASSIAMAAPARDIDREGGAANGVQASSAGLAPPVCGWDYTAAKRERRHQWRPGAAGHRGRRLQNPRETKSGLAKELLARESPVAFAATVVPCQR